MAPADMGVHLHRDQLEGDTRLHPPLTDLGAFMGWLHLRIPHSHPHPQEGSIDLLLLPHRL